jgi:membrane associated rhomboid family serine protease
MKQWFKNIMFHIKLLLYKFKRPNIIQLVCMRVTLSLIIINFVVFVLQIFVGGFTEAFSLTPVNALGGAYWQFFTYMFLHGSPMHIGINMLVLLIFGFAIENSLGIRKYLLLYFASGIGSAFLYIALTANVTTLMLGASGAVFGVLTAYGFLFPRNWIVMFPGIPMPALLAVVVFAFIELFSGVFGLEPGIANFGHLGGIIVGVILMAYWKYIKKEKQKIESFEFFWE